MKERRMQKINVYLLLETKPKKMLERLKQLVTWRRSRNEMEAMMGIRIVTLLSTIFRLLESC